MKIAEVLTLLVIATSTEVCSGFRILAYYQLPVRSHFHMIDQLLVGLARNGNQVDLVSVFAPKHKHYNYTHIVSLPFTEETVKFQREMNFKKLNTAKYILNIIVDTGYYFCQGLGSPEFLNLARNPPTDPPYDVIITQMMNYHCFMILGHLWNVPVVLISTTSLYPWMHDMIGNPENIAISPNNMYPVPEENSFWSRFCNTYMFYLIKFNYILYSRNQNELLQKYFGPNAPSLQELERSTALVLVNTYFPINGVKPTVQNLIEVGGIHIQNNGPELNDDLKKWLDESNGGVIYFSLGSVYRIETFPEDKIRIMFKTLKNISPVRVLMRLAHPEDLKVKVPKNFHTLKWIPQEKVLQHPNVKVFITHSGLLSTQESIYYGVPMVCVPMLADQWSNANNNVRLKIAVRVYAETLTQHDFDYAVNETLHNSIYRKNVKRLSSLYRDRPQSAMETATFWIEFVARNGKDSLISPAMKLTWWQLALLDVFVVTILGLLIILFIIILIIKCLLRLLFSKKSSAVSNEKKRS